MPHQQSPAPAILVIGPSWVGDMVMAQSLFKLLKQRLPQCQIDVVAPGWSLPIIQRIPEVRETQVLNVGHGEGGLQKRYRLGKQLRSKNYSQAIVLPRSLKSALVPFFANIPQRTGFKGEFRYGLLNDIRPFDKKYLDQTVKRFSYLGLEHSSDELEVFQPGLEVDKKNAQSCIEKLGLDAEKYTVALLPGAEYGPAKQWPASHFADLIRQIDQAGAQAWIIGSAKDKPMAQEIVSLAGGAGINLWVAIYGSSSPEYTPPLTNDASINWLQLDCSPCFQRQCKFGHYNCLNNISAEAIFPQLGINHK